MRATHLCTLIIAALAVGGAASAGDEKDYVDDWVPKEKFDDPVRSFNEVRDELLRNYYKDDITEADVYRAATQGMLTRLDPSLKAYNQLLSPSQANDLQVDLKGIYSGVGFQSHYDAANGMLDVTGIIPGTPAERAGMKPGDRILAVDGVPFKQRPEHDMLSAIRGKEGEPVRLEILRDTKVTTFTIVRQRISLEPLRHQHFPGDVEVLTISSFSERTPAALRKALEEINQSHAKGLVVDLRDNSGGLIEEALHAAKAMLPKGTPITRLVHRGKRVENVIADSEPVLKPIPTVVLVGDMTMSSAELLASALRSGLHSPLLGGKTRGKWSVQSLKELPNHYVMKYTVAVFQTPDGKSYEGTGLPPDVEVNMDTAALERCMPIRDAETRLAADVQLRAAVNLLRMRP
ncbi:MAG TPA: S41 family peptidase [Myxococcaceae bacterium]|nr:S41 family peptidase [Myxococcaceae bacterium]